MAQGFEDFRAAQEWMPEIRAAVGSRLAEGQTGPVPCEIFPVRVCGLDDLERELRAEGTPPVSIVSMCSEVPSLLPRNATHHIYALRSSVDLITAPDHFLLDFFRALDRGLERGHLTYIHCQLGASRSVCAAVAYLLWRGVPLREALVNVVRTRPRIAITEFDILGLHQLARKIQEAKAKA